MVDLSPGELTDLCTRSLLAAGASPAQADILASATVEAESLGMRAVGVSHLEDYLDGFRGGRILPVSPVVEQVTSVISAVDCREGLAQHGFSIALPGVVAAANEHGVALAWLRGCFTAGELGYYPRQLNRAGLVGLAVANSPALVSIAGSHGPVVGSNPLAFGAPLPGDRRLAFDQASAATAWVAVREAANGGQPIPEGWAVDLAGTPTTSAALALAGALLPFGGYKGGNIAIMVEVLSTIGGGMFSVEAPPFHCGSASPSIGVFVAAIAPAVLDSAYPARLDAELKRWRDEHGTDTSVWVKDDETPAAISITEELHARLQCAGCSTR